MVQAVALATLLPEARNMTRLTTVLLASAVLAGCATIPKLPKAPEAAAGGSFATTQSFQAPEAEWPDDRWWAAYGDPQLDALMDEAVAGSPTLAQAAARLRAAEARAQQSRAATLPTLDANGQASETKQSYNNGIPADFVPRGYNDTGRATLDLSYDLDLWGRNRAALKAATSEAEAARMDAAEARLTLTTAIAGAYADFARLTAEHDAAAAALKNREASADLVAHRVTGGAANPGEAEDRKSVV